MSVKVCDRSESHAQFIEQARKINVRLGQIVVNAPKKYSQIYGRRLAEDGFDLLKHCLTANKIFLAKNSKSLIFDFQQRRQHLLDAKGMVTVLASETKIYFDLMLNAHEYYYPREDDAILTKEQENAKRASEKAIGRMKDIGEMLAEQDKLLSGVLAYDNKRVREWGYNGS